YPPSAPPPPTPTLFPYTTLFRSFQESDAQALKIEGASEETLTLTKRLTNGGIPVIGHLGLTPQTVNVLGGYRVQGKDEAASKKLDRKSTRLNSSHVKMSYAVFCL